MGDETNKRRRRDLFLPLFDGEALLNSLFSLDLAHSELILSFVLIFLIKPLIFFHLLGAQVGGTSTYMDPLFTPLWGGLPVKKILNKIRRKFKDRLQRNCIFGAMTLFFMKKKYFTDLRLFSSLQKTFFYYPKKNFSDFKRFFFDTPNIYSIWRKFSPIR